MAKDAKTIREELARPFAPEDLEWRIQVTSKDKTSGLAIPYVTNRAIQDRLDEVVGPENWYNDYKPWHGNGKKDAQICGISIYFEDKGFITKWDGAEDSDIEPIKGGLSDSMKRSAVQWGIGLQDDKASLGQNRAEGQLLCDLRHRTAETERRVLGTAGQAASDPRPSWRGTGTAQLQARRTGRTAGAEYSADGHAADAAVSAAASVYDAAGLPVRCVVCEQSAGYVRPAVGLRRSAKHRGQAGHGLCTG